MTPISAVSLSGMQAAQMRMNASANNIANQQTIDYRRQQVAQATTEGGGVVTTVTQAPAPGTALEADMVEQLVASNSFLANMVMFSNGQRTMGSLLNVKA